MKYKQLVLQKLEALDNIVGGINSLLSQQQLTREQVDNWQQRMKSKMEEIATLINSEQELY